MLYDNIMARRCVQRQPQSVLVGTLTVLVGTVTLQRIITPNAVGQPFHRDGAILAIYVLLGLLTSSYGMLGPLLPWLRPALGLSFEQAAYHTVAMAIGVTGMGILVPLAAVRVGRKGSLGLGLTTMALGLAILCLAPDLRISLTGSLIVGMTLPLGISVSSAVMAERSGPHIGIAMAEANTIAYIGFLMAPGIVNLAEATVGWRWSFVIPALIYALYGLAIRNLPLGAVQMHAATGGTGRLSSAYWCHWAMLSLGVAAELSMAVWAPSYLETAARLPRETALWSSMIFPLGMFAGRAAVSLMLRRMRADALVLPSMLLGAVGVLIFVLAQEFWLAAAGMLVAGLGMAGLYPFGITLVMLAAGEARDRGAARAALASGAATLTAPVLIGAVADKAGMRAAFGLIPLFLLLAGIAHLMGKRLDSQLKARS